LISDFDNQTKNRYASVSQIYLSRVSKMPIYICPLSLDAPRVPVITNEGITYDFVYIARSLLRENTDTINPTPDPTTQGAIDTLIYNRSTKELNDALMDTVPPLSHEEKTGIASLYTQLISRYPALKIYGVHTLEGMQALIGAPMPASQLAPELQPNFVDTDGRTSLYIAAQNGLVDVVRQLLMRDDVRPNQGMTLERLRGATPLIAAAEKGHVPVVLALLADPRVEPSQAKADGATALFVAAQKGRKPLVMTLLADQRVNPNQANIWGGTPLYIAADREHLTVVAALVDAGANPNQANIWGETPLFIAARKGRLTVVSALLDAGADFNQAKIDGATPLFIAAQHGHLTVVAALLGAGANPNSEMTDGATPLFTAILFGHFEVVQALQRHQDATMAHPPTSIATQHGYPLFVRALLSDETVRDYYLNQIIIKPKLMRDAFTQNPVFFTELVTHRNALWAQLREPAYFNLSPDEHRDLLRTILGSRQEPNEALRHPLYVLFNKSRPWGLFSFFRHVSNTTTANTILDDVQEQVDAITEYNPMHSIFVGNRL
jgi:ankyrin repeat protein